MVGIEGVKAPTLGDKLSCITFMTIFIIGAIFMFNLRKRALQKQKELNKLIKKFIPFQRKNSWKKLSTIKTVSR